MREYALTDVNGKRFTYAASDIQMALLVHQMATGTEVVKVKLRDKPLKILQIPGGSL